jgi:outer membrane immunogenic protein
MAPHFGVFARQHRMQITLAFRLRPNAVRSHLKDSGRVATKVHHDSNPVEDMMKIFLPGFALRPAIAVAAALSAAAAVFGATSAQAADLADRPYTKSPPAVAAVYDWTGFYVGGNIGYGWGANTGNGYTSFTDTDIGGVADFFAAGGNVLPGVSPTGVIGGGQIGYDWQVSPVWIVGLVADIQGSNMRASATGAASIDGFTGITESNSAKVDWFGTVRGRAGFVASNLLIYGTGGLAYGQVRANTALNDPSNGFGPVSFAGSTTSTRTGWSAGAGVEYALTRNWRVGAEYLHVDLGTLSVT